MVRGTGGGEEEGEAMAESELVGEVLCCSYLVKDPELRNRSIPVTSWR